MPQPASAVAADAFLRVLILGAPKVGKTYTAVTTCAGPAYVIDSDGSSGLRGASRVTSDFEWDLATGEDPQDIEKCLHYAREGVASGKYKTVIWDTLTQYSERSLDAFERANAAASRGGQAHGLRFFYQHRKHLEHIVDELFKLKAHVIVLSHYVETSEAKLDVQVAKKGRGIAPGLPGQARASIPARFTDVIFLEKVGADRIFTLSDEGIFGPGSRSLPGVKSTPASLKRLWKTIRAADEAPQATKAPAGTSNHQKGT